MPTLPIVAPDWATANTYGAGARPWNGQANKTQPSAGMIAEGFDPENPLFADLLNFILWNHGQYIDYIIGTLGGAAYGSGYDGALVFDGVNPITLGDGSTINPSSGSYALPRALFPDTCVLSGGTVTNGAGNYPIICRTSFTTSGGVVRATAANGGNGNAGTGGAGGGGATVGTGKG